MAWLTVWQLHYTVCCFVILTLHYHDDIGQPPTRLTSWIPAPFSHAPSRRTIPVWRSDRIAFRHPDKCLRCSCAHDLIKTDLPLAGFSAQIFLAPFSHLCFSELGHINSHSHWENSTSLRPQEQCPFSGFYPLRLSFKPKREDI